VAERRKRRRKKGRGDGGKDRRRFGGGVEGTASGAHPRRSPQSSASSSPEGAGRGARPRSGDMEGEDGADPAGSGLWIPGCAFRKARIRQHRWDLQEASGAGTRELPTATGGTGSGGKG